MLVLSKLGIALRGGTIAVALLWLLAGSATASSLSGSVGAGAKFPARALVLSAPAGVPVTVRRVYVSENGKPVDNLSVTPLKAAGAGDFGVVLVIDQSETMRGAPLAQALAAARAIAAQRTGKQELGVITFASTPRTVLSMTSDVRTIGRVLSTTPGTRSGTRILPALMAGLQQLARANIADGAVILLSDGAATGSGNLTPASVAAAARVRHVKIFTVGLRDSAFAPGLMRRLAQLGGGKFVAATGTQLPRVFTDITAALAQSYLLRYRSILAGGQPVAVTVHVDGVPKNLRLSYSAPAPASPLPSPSAAPPSAPPSGTRSSITKSPGSKSSGTKSSIPRSVSAPAALGQASPNPVWRPGSPAVGHATKPRPRTTAAHGVQMPPTSTVPSGQGWKPRAARRSFWTSSLALLAIAGGSALLIVLAIAIVIFRRPTQRAVQRRVGSFTLASPDADQPASAPWRGRVSGLLTRRRRWPAFVEQVETARMKRSPLDIVKRWVIASAVAAFLLGEVTGAMAVGLLVLVAAPFLLRAVISRGARRQRRRFTEQLPSHLQDLAGAMRAGRSFIGAIAAVADSATEPIRGEFERAVADERLGLPLEETLEAVARRMHAKDMEQVALIASLHRRSGSNVSEALERVAEGARERADLGREMRALTGQARLSAWVLSGLPPAMLAALTVVAPSYSHPLFHTVPGVVLLVIAAGMVGSGWLVMNRIVNPEA